MRSGAYRKRSHIFGSEEPNLIAIRTKSYCPKNQILWAEDMAAFLPSAMCDDCQGLMRALFLLVFMPTFALL